MKHILTVIMSLVLLPSCKKADSNQDVCNMGYFYANDSDMVEEDEPELIPVPLDTTILKGSWKLVQYHSPYFNMVPTDKFDYIIKFSSGSIEMHFVANELLCEYHLQGDSLRLGNGLMTKALGGDAPLEQAIYDLLMDRKLTIQCTMFSDLAICIMAEDEINGNTYADFRKIK
ncbi:MAG: hypothetical protein HDS84_08970 [Bacteroidales bacterium]|nr:hypothetical protein [Bacteroidales bacterium]